MGTLDRLVRAIHRRQVVAEITRDPDPEPDHDYQRDPQSGAGNCVCGMTERHRVHPHEYVGAPATDGALCTCALPPEATCHRESRLQ